MLKFSVIKTAVVCNVPVLCRTVWWVTVWWVNLNKLAMRILYGPLKKEKKKKKNSGDRNLLRDPEPIVCLDSGARNLFSA